MTQLLGISICGLAVHAVLVERTHVLWHSSMHAASSEAITDAVTTLVSASPPHRWRRQRAIVAVGAPHCRYKRIEGLPPVTSVRVAERVVHENSAAFFLRFAPRISVGALELKSDGTCWAAAFDAGLVEEWTRALNRLGYARVKCAPAVAVTQCSPAAIMVDQIGADYTTALAAAFSGWAVAAGWRPERTAQQSSDALRRGWIAGAAVASTVMGAMFFVPAILARSAAEHTTHVASTSRGARADAARIQRSLDTVTAELDQLTRFSRERGRLTLLAGAVGRAVPESTAFLTLRLDSLEGSIVTLSPRAADVLPELMAVEEVLAPRIAGSVTREVIGGVRVERATVRFRIRRPVR